MFCDTVRVVIQANLRAAQGFDQPNGAELSFPTVCLCRRRFQSTCRVVFS